MTTAPPPTRRLMRLGPGRQDRTRDAVATGGRLSEPHDAVPLLHEGGVARLEVRPVRGEEQLEVAELLPRQHRRRVVAERAVQEERGVLVHGLAASGCGARLTTPRMAGVAGRPSEGATNSMSAPLSLNSV